jgi:hypothetical protein
MQQTVVDNRLGFAVHHPTRRSGAIFLLASAEHPICSLHRGTSPAEVYDKQGSSLHRVILSILHHSASIQGFVLTATHAV